MAETASAAVITSTGSRERQNYRFRQLVSHLNSAEAWEKLFDLLEEKPFLAEQADHFGGFEPSGEDIEGHVLSATIHLEDWNRFLRYASLALNLRGLAEGLAAPEILRALVQGKKLALARDLVDRLADPLRRAEARAILAHAWDSMDNVFSKLLQGIEEDLETVPPEAQALTAIARSLGPELSSRWRGWIERLPAGTDEVWAAVAASWLDRGEAGATGLWEALGEIRDPRLLLGLIIRIGEISQGEIGEMFKRIASLPGNDAVSRHQALANFLSRQSRQRPEPAVSIWKRWTASEPISWTVELIEACRELIQHLSSLEAEALGSTLEAPEARAAVRVARLETHQDHEHTVAALEAVGHIPDGPAKLHWSLRYLEARPAEPVLEVQGQVGAVAAYLYELRYEAAASDLRRFLDLMDRFYPDAVKRLAEDVAWSPASRRETLLTLAGETTRECVAEQLLENAERFASSVSLNEAEGFRLRGELIRQAACRLCLLRKDLKGLEIAAGRLLSEEEDELREMLAPVLAGAGLRKHGLEVADGIQDPRRQFLTRLRTLPAGEIPSDFLASRSLYGAMASTQSLEEERLALSALHSNPFDPQELARHWISPIRSGNLQTQALFRLARHALAFQRSFYGRRQDTAAALAVVRGSIAIETDERLVELTTEIALLGAEAGPKETVSEFQEAARRLVEIDTVPWALRAEALERLLSRLGPCLLPQEESGRRTSHRAIAVLESIARLPLGSRTNHALGDLRSRWHEILPFLVAAADRLPGVASRSLDGAIQQGVSACDGAGGEAAERIFSLCLAPATERLGLSERALVDEPDSILRLALAYLLGTREPKRIPEIIRPLPQKARDHLILRLVRFRWITPEQAGPLLNLIMDSVLRKRADLWVNLDHLNWLDDLAALVLVCEVDPSQPSFGDVINRLWACDPGKSRPTLATAFVNALRVGGRGRGEAALRLWLHSHLAPILGTEQPEALLHDEETRIALKRSLVLSP
jgi:hypothetical protein